MLEQLLTLKLREDGAFDYLDKKEKTKSDLESTGHGVYLVNLDKAMLQNFGNDLAKHDFFPYTPVTVESNNRSFVYAHNPHDDAPSGVFCARNLLVMYDAKDDGSGNLVRLNPRVLLFRNSKAKGWKSNFDNAGGQVRPSEFPQAAADREVKEETGITELDTSVIIQIGGYQKMNVWDYKFKTACPVSDHQLTFLRVVTDEKLRQLAPGAVQKLDLSRELDEMKVFAFETLLGEKIDGVNKDIIGMIRTVSNLLKFPNALSELPDCGWLKYNPKAIKAEPYFAPVQITGGGY